MVHIGQYMMHQGDLTMPHSGQQNDFTSKISLCTGFCLFWPGFGQGLYGLCYFGLA